MYGYEKKIVYLDFKKNGERIGNAGFAKLIVQGGEMRLAIHVSGLHKTDSLKVQLMMLQGMEEILLDELLLREGSCVYSRLFTLAVIREMGIRVDTMYGISVRIDEKRTLEGIWGDRPQPEQQEEQQESQPEWQQEPQEEIQPEWQQESQEEPQPERPETDEMEEITACFAEPEEVPEVPVTRETEQKDLAAGQISDDKWLQLGKVFPKVHPFGDEKEYLSVEPKDFIVLTKAYQNLANNSFLLHGFYNYHHIILGKLVRNEQEHLYLGVPGVFYEREKAVALMFGFESFECAREPARTGTFGYYMKQVEI